MQASNVTCGTGVKGGGKGGPPGAHHGSCKSFNGETGFGFIMSLEGLWKDLFFDVEGMSDGSTPQAGDHLTFDFELDAAGELKAQNIRGGTGWDAGKGGKGKGCGYSWCSPYGGGKDKGFGKKGGWGGDSWKGGGKGGWGGDSWGGNGGW